MAHSHEETGMEPAKVERVVASPAAQALIARLRAKHGEVFLYQSHGCCDGSTPMCFKPGEMPLSPDDVCLGHVGGVPFYAGRVQSEYMQGTQTILDVGHGPLGSFSLEEEEGVHFKAGTRLWNDEESAWLAAHPLVG
jgi:uncharacterized protein (DUF779 family)